MFLRTPIPWELFISYKENKAEIMFTGHCCPINTGKVPQHQNVTIQAFSGRPIDTGSVRIWAVCLQVQQRVRVCCDSSGLCSRSHLALLQVCQLFVFMERSRARATAADRFNTSLADHLWLVAKSWTQSETRHNSGLRKVVVIQPEQYK